MSAVARPTRDSTANPAPRRIVQIATPPGDLTHMVVALCDDGSLWVTRIVRREIGKYPLICHPWTSMPPIPQPERLPADD